jgi:DnaJ-class molecular chaperone
MRANYFQLLGLSSDASQEEIKQAYRRLAQAYHPDKNIKNKDNKELDDRFVKIAEAYRILSDPIQKNRYCASMGAITQPRHDSLGSSVAKKIKSIIKKFIQASGPWPQRGKDLLLVHRLNPKEARCGGKFQVTYKRWETSSLVERTLEIDLPAAIKTDQRIRFKGEGDQGTAGGRAGDLIIEAHIET